MAEIKKSDIKNKGGTFRMDLEEKRVGTTEIYDGKIIHVFVDDCQTEDRQKEKLWLIQAA